MSPNLDTWSAWFAPSFLPSVYNWTRHMAQFRLHRRVGEHVVLVETAVGAEVAREVDQQRLVLRAGLGERLRIVRPPGQALLLRRHRRAAITSRRQVRRQQGDGPPGQAPDEVQRARRKDGGDDTAAPGDVMPLLLGLVPRPVQNAEPPAGTGRHRRKGPPRQSAARAGSEASTASTGPRWTGTSGRRPVP